mmetsp:Transcript_4353/g.5720  ORF Transcript_4353/g.5720 Transcript_4353/m.5720 type:complete len:101 (-) Transcript_4353:1081-1383(-)
MLSSASSLPPLPYLPPQMQNTPATQWLSRCETTTSKTFPPNSLNTVDSIPFDVELERIIGIHIYMIGNVFPFLILPFILLYTLLPSSHIVIQCIVVYVLH